MECSYEKYEYPCAFALFEAIGRKKPDRVLYGSELPMVWIYPNMYYVIAPALWRSPEEVKESYLAQEQERLRTEQEKAESKRKQEQAYKSRQEGKAKESDTPKTRPIIPTRTKRQMYRKPAVRTVYTKPPNSTFKEVEERQPKEYHTTRGVKVRR